MASEKLTWMFELLDKMSGPANRIFQAMKKLTFADVGNAIGGFVNKVRGLPGAVGSAFGAVAERFKPVAAAFSTLVAPLTDAAKRAFGAIAERAAPIVSAVSGFLSPIGAAVAARLAPIADVARSALAAVGSKLSSAGSVVSGAVGGVMSSVAAKLRPIGAAISGVFGSIVSKLKPHLGNLKSFLGALGTFFKPALDALGGAFKKVASSIGGAFKSIGPTALKGLGAVASGMLAIGGAAAVAVGALAVAGGKFVGSALVFKEDSLAAFEAILNSRDAANEVMAMATKFAAKTPFKTSEVVDMAKSLLTRGFKKDELENLMKGVGDVGAMLGTEKMDSVINALGKMRANGKMTGETLQMLADAGINSQLVFAALGSQLGKSKDEIEKLMSAGKITDAQAIKATMDAIAKGLSGGELGGAMDKKSKTLSGLLSTLESVPEELVFAANMDAVIGPVKKFVELLTSTLSTESPTGKRVIKMLESIGQAIGEVFGDMMKGRSLAETFDSILNVVEPLVKVLLSFGKGVFSGLGTVLGAIVDQLGKMDPSSIADMAQGFAMFGKALGTVLGVVVAFIGGMLALEMTMVSVGSSIVSTVGDALTWLGDTLGSIADFFTLDFSGIEWSGIWDSISSWFSSIDWASLGIAIVEGLIVGIASMLSPLTMGVVGVVATIKDAFTTGLGIASPSKVFAGYGADTGQGFLQGLAGSGVGKALTDLATPPALKLPNAVGGGGDTGPTGFFGALKATLPMVPGAATMPGLVAGIAGAAGIPGLPGLPGAPGAPADSVGLLDGLASLFGAAPPPAIQPASASGPAAGSQGMAAPGGPQNMTLSGMPPIQIIVNGAENAAAAGQEAADSFVAGLGAALKGLASRAGG